MEYFFINDLISEKISGEWGSDPTSGKCVKVIRTTNFTNEGKIKFSNIVERDILESKVEKKRLKKGDIIIEKSGGSPTQPVGRVVFFDVEDNDIYLCNNFTSILRPSKKILPKFLFYSLFFLHLNNKTLKYQNKTTGIINLQLDRYIKTEKIPLLSLKDQQVIINILDKSDIILQKRRESISLLDDYLKSVFFEMFGDPVKNTKKWKKEPLNYFGKIITGNTPPRSDVNNYSSNYIEWIKTDNIVEGEIYITNAAEYLSESGLNKSRFVEPGAVLIACIAGSVESIGRVAITNRRVAFNQQINAIQSNKNVNPLFLYWLIKNSKKYILSHASKGMKKILTKGVFEKIVMILPPVYLQNEFALEAEKVELLKGKMVSQSKELENQFQALMQNAFKGEL
ncbi:MAG: restriction endonuclease subunit S [Candidatus Pacebacteria bacterium]|nr:restriction endonuclease subunit S [Candidatus Paceibacterota bacterium]